MPRPLPLLAVCLLLVIPDLAARPALRPGEGFTYKVSWGLLGTVGVIRVQDQAAADPATSSVSVDTRSAGLARVLFPFSANATSFFSRDDGALLRATAETRSRGKSTNASIVFDYAAEQARYTDHLDAERNTTIALPETQPAELITSLIGARDFDLKPGETRAISVLFDDEFYDLNLRAGDYETVHTADGRVTALRITPEPIGPPKGMFKRGGAVRVWLSHDEARLPVRFEVELKVGTAVALLSKHTPGAL